MPDATNQEQIIRLTESEEELFCSQLKLGIFCAVLDLNFD